MSLKLGYLMLKKTHDQISIVLDLPMRISLDEESDGHSNIV